MSSAPTNDGKVEQAVASARAVADVRARLRSMPAASRLIVVGLGCLTVVASALLLLTLDRVTPNDLLEAAALALVYGLATRVRFESAAVNAVPTEPILVAAALLLPVQLVPAVAMVGLLLVERTGERQSRTMAFFGVAASNLVVLGPVVVLYWADLDEVSIDHWPVYLLALLAQFAVDAFTSSAYCVVYDVPVRELPRKLGWTYLLDALLAPFGLMAVITCNGTPWSIVLASLPVALIALLARDRKENLEQAVTISEALEVAMNTARHDPLTDVSNRRAWSEATAHAAIAFAADPQHTTVTVVLGDVDGLKVLNDTYGHEAGDLLIRAAADAFRAAAPTGALVARLGGDEFGMLIVGGEVRREQMLDDLRAAIDLAPTVHGTPLSISIGVASCPEFEAVEDALAAADARVYVDKARRRVGRGTAAVSEAARPSG